MLSIYNMPNSIQFPEDVVRSARSPAAAPARGLDGGGEHDGALGGQRASSATATSGLSAPAHTTLYSRSARGSAYLNNFKVRDLLAHAMALTRRVSHDSQRLCTQLIAKAALVAQHVKQQCSWQGTNLYVKISGNTPETQP